MSPTIKIVAFLLLTFIACYFYFENIKGYTTKKKVWLGIVILLGFLFGIWDIIVTYIEANKDKVELIDTTKQQGEKMRSKVDNVGSIVIRSADNTNKKLDTGFNILKKKSNIKTKYPAIIGLSTMEQFNTNPSVEKNKTGDTLGIMCLLSNYGKGVAFNIRVSAICVDLYNGKLFGQKGKMPQSGNKSTQWQAKESIKNPIFFHLYTKDTNDSLFCCIKIDFSDSIKSQKSFPQIFLLDRKSLGLHVVTDEDYNRVEAFLKKNKYWKPPFRQ